MIKYELHRMLLPLVEVLFLASGIMGYALFWEHPSSSQRQILHSLQLRQKFLFVNEVLYGSLRG